MTTTRVIFTPDGFADPEDQAHQDPASQQWEAARVVGGTIRQSVGGGGTQDLGVTRHTRTTNDDTSRGVAATLDHGYGPNATVMLPGGVRTSVAAAEVMGFIKRNASGEWVDVDPAQRAAQEQAAEPEQQQQQGDPGRDAFTPNADAEYDALIAPLPQGAYDAAGGRMTAHIAHGTGSLDSMARALSGDTGLDPSDAREVIQRAYQHYSDAVARAVAPYGVTAESLAEFYASCKTRPGLLAHAVERLRHMRDPSGFIQLAREFAAGKRG